jgi:hypothetical protein
MLCGHRGGIGESEGSDAASSAVSYRPGCHLLPIRAKSTSGPKERSRDFRRYGIILNRPQMFSFGTVLGLLKNQKQWHEDCQGDDSK